MTEASVIVEKTFFYISKNDDLFFVVDNRKNYETQAWKDSKILIFKEIF